MECGPLPPDDDRDDHRRQVSDPRPDRRRRDGRGLPRARPRAGPRGRPEDAATSPWPTTPRSSTGSAARPARPPPSATPTSWTSTTGARPAGTYFMVMEFIRGANLRSLLMRDGALEPAARRSTSPPSVLAALEHAHTPGHRPPGHQAGEHHDPGLRRRGEGRRLRAGPGVRRLAGQPGRREPSPGPCSTWPPSRSRGCRPTPGPTCTRWASCLYELLTGEVPFTGETSMAIAWRHLRERVPAAVPGQPDGARGAGSGGAERHRAGPRPRTKDAATMRADLSRADAEASRRPRCLAELASVGDAGRRDPGRPALHGDDPADPLPEAAAPPAHSQGLPILSLVIVVLAVAAWAVWTFVVPHPTTVPDLIGDQLSHGRRRGRSGRARA